MNQLGVKGLLWMKQFLQRLKEEKGVTLIELLAVVVILAIIAAVAVPTVLGQINKSKIAADQSTEQIIVDALQRAEFDYQSTANTTNSIYINTTTVANNTSTSLGYLMNNTTYASVEVGNNSQSILGLLENGYTNGSNSTTGRGFVSSISAPNTGSDWQISTNNTTANVPSASFTFANDSSGDVQKFYLYPAK